MFTLKLDAQDIKLLNESIEINLYEKSQLILSYNGYLLNDDICEEHKKLYAIKCDSLRKECSRLQRIKNKLEQKMKVYIVN